MTIHVLNDHLSLHNLEGKVKLVISFVCMDEVAFGNYSITIMTIIAKFPKWNEKLHKDV